MEVVVELSQQLDVKGVFRVGSTAGRRTNGPLQRSEVFTALCIVVSQSKLAGLTNQPGGNN